MFRRSSPQDAKKHARWLLVWTWRLSPCISREENALDASSFLFLRVHAFAGLRTTARSSPQPQRFTTLVPPVRPFRLPPRTGIETQMDVTLHQALAMALANNKDIESSRIDRLESDYSLDRARSGRSIRSSDVTSYWEQQITPIASSLGGSATGSLLNKTWQADPGITQPLPWYGGTFQDGFVVRVMFFQQHLSFAKSAV